ncbi:phage terminase small subunit P27 family [Granulicatella sp. zg-ZJ]|uniref:phage terminase small subunit P27 family n=1 Tax=Granulicatella sp. zg-ZJ TaxID=2678504 RepID=UPI0013D06941|nr:phage terminase small subunit P27 family [Granulicatella sp. zg-ZJ]
MSKVAMPLELRLLNGSKPKRSNEEINMRLQAEKSLKTARNKLKPPDWLGDIAKKEFKYVVNETKEIELLGNLDVHALALYCNVYEQYILCTKRIVEDGIIVEANKASETVTAAHPLFIRQHQLMQQLRMMQNDLGLSPSARAKLALHAVNQKPISESEREFGNV